jgi:apolipoprotein N-acyltransferase
LALAVFALLIVSASSLNSFLLPSISLTSTVSESDHSQGNKTLRVRAIQGGTPSVGLDFNSRAMGVLKMHIEQTRKDFQERDQLIVWPENAIDIDPVKNVVVSQLIKDLLQEIDRPLLAGAIISTDRGPVNSIVYFDKNGEIQGIYEKRYLTPFGEYIPLRSIAEFLSPYAERVNDFVPGNKETVFHINDVDIASVICYEIINDGLVRSSSRNSDLLFIHTNSATFAGTSEGDQQLAITQLRAIEHQRSLLSVSTTGPSALVNERGEVVYRLAEGDRGSISTTMQVADARSISSSLGGVANILVLLLALLSALAGSMRQMRFRR